MRSKISLSFARLLQSLLSGEVNAASFSASNKQMLEKFIQDGVLEFRLIGNQQRKIFCADSVNLAKYLHNKFGIPALDDYITFLEREDIQRSDAVKAVSDTKFRKTKVFTGFLLNCYEELSCKLDSMPLLIKPTTGAFTFISAYEGFTIPSDVTVVVVEGHENFREIERQKYLFERIRPLFVWRYQNSNAIAAWLNLIPNPYLHFGDFDPKGIQIYLSEFKSKIKGNRGQLLIPGNLEKLIMQYGEKALYEKQKEYITQIRDIPEAQPLVELILKHKKGLAQEIFIM